MTLRLESKTYFGTSRTRVANVETPPCFLHHLSTKEARVERVSRYAALVPKYCVFKLLRKTISLSILRPLRSAHFWKYCLWSLCSSRFPKLAITSQAGIKCCDTPKYTWTSTYIRTRSITKFIVNEYDQQTWHLTFNERSKHLHMHDQHQRRRISNLTPNMWCSFRFIRIYWFQFGVWYISWLSKTATDHEVKASHILRQVRT